MALERSRAVGPIKRALQAALVCPLIWPDYVGMRRCCGKRLATPSGLAKSAAFRICLQETRASRTSRRERCVPAAQPSAWSSTVASDSLESYPLRAAPSVKPPSGQASRKSHRHLAPGVVADGAAAVTCAIEKGMRGRTEHDFQPHGKGKERGIEWALPHAYSDSHTGEAHLSGPGIGPRCGNPARSSRGPVGDTRHSARH